MKTRSIIISALSSALVLSSCTGTDEVSPGQYGAPSLGSTTSAATEKVYAITLNASASKNNFQTCGFYYGTDRSLSDARKISAVKSKDFSSSFEPDGYGKTYYWQAYVTNNSSEVRSSVSSVSSLPFSKYVRVYTPTAVVTSSGAVKVTTTVDVAKGISFTEKGVCYSTEHTPTVASPKVSSWDDIYTIYATIEGLTPGLTYYLRCYACDGDEVSYSPVISLAVNNSPSVSTSDVKDVTSSYASCGGNVTSDGGATVTERGIVWSTSQNPTITSYSGKTSNGTGTGSFTSSLTGLSSSTTYYVRAYATNSKGTAYGEQKSFTTTGSTSYEAVDLGLSVKWASFNVGASKPEDYGDYYAWGETSTKSNYDWSTYKWCKGRSTTMTKYCASSEYGTVDNKTVLESSDDVAYVQWGGSWRMPTADEWQELYDNCTWTWTTISGVNGYKVTSKKTGYTSKWIFLPAAGCRDGTYLNNVGSGGLYWSSSLYSGRSYFAYDCWFTSDYVNPRSYDGRYYGLAVRPVCGESASSNVPTVTTSSVTSITETSASCGGNITSDGGATVTARGVVWSTSQNPTITSYSGKTSNGTGTGSFTSSLTGLSASTTYYIRAYATNSKGTAYGEQKSFTTAGSTSYEAVDLGLSVKWATCNVGAATYTDYGDYYAWGETSTKNNYDWGKYKWCKGSITTMTKYCTYSSYGTVDNKTVLESSDDVAHVKWGGSWRMPTSTEWQELYDNCTWIWTTISGVNGYKVTSNKSGYTDRWIFLPVAGYRIGTYLYSVGSDGYYWSSSLFSGYSYYAYNCWFYSDYVYPRHYDCRYYGHTVRPVCN